MDYMILREHLVRNIDHYEEFEMYYLSGYRLGEIAWIYGITERTVQRRINKVKCRLQDILLE